MADQKKQAADLVEQIPANLINTKSITLDVISYAGHITVNKTRGDHLFYWFFESKNSRYSSEPEKIPLVIWLNGGPGYSSLPGLFQENGPFLMGEDDTGTIVANPYSWNEKAHVLYWDQPVGTGYSYSSKGHYVSNEDELSEEFYAGLQGFYKLHPEYRKCPLYVTGESYAGKYVPYISTKIMNKNETCAKEERINLKGLAVGDGWMNPRMQVRAQLDYAFEMSFVDTKQKAQLETIYLAFCSALDEKKIKLAATLGNYVCEATVRCGGKPFVYDVRRWSDISIDLLRKYLDLPAVKQALHVPNQVQWVCSDDDGLVSEALIEDEMADMTFLFPPLLEKYQVLLYTGNFDMSCGFTGTEKILYDLEWPHREEWRALDRKIWVRPPEKTLGYVKALKRKEVNLDLLQVVIVGAGHMVPQDQPRVSRSMIYNWLFGLEFPGYTYHIEIPTA